MPVYDVGEKWDSRSGSRGDGGGDELVIIEVYGIPDGGGDPTIGGARALALAEAPAIAGLFMQKIGHKPLGGFRWLFTLEYGTRPKSTDQIGIEFEIATVSQKRLCSISTVAKYGGTRDFKGAINVSKDRVEGCEVPIGEARFTLKKWFKPADLSISFFLTALELAGKTNSATFYGLPAGSLLFEGLGASWIYDLATDPEDQEPVEVPARFKFSPNVGEHVISGITVAAKKGWEYLWPYFEDDVDETNKLLIAKPAQINREKVIESADFSALGFGTSF
jgi:hypothetical protein